MARKRQIDPKFWLDYEVSQLSCLARLTYIGLWNIADDHGILEYKPEEIRAFVFPYEPKIKIQELLNELIKIGKLIPYEVNNQKYLFIKNLNKHQSILHPSYRYPTFKEESHTPIIRVLDEYKGIEQSRVEQKNSDKSLVSLIKTESSPHKEIINYFYMEVKESKGFAPEINGYKDGKRLKECLKKYSVKQLKDLIDYYLASEKSDKLAVSLSTALSTDTINHWLQDEEAII